MVEIDWKLDIKKAKANEKNKQANISICDTKTFQMQRVIGVVKIWFIYDQLNPSFTKSRYCIQSKPNGDFEFVVRPGFPPFTLC